MSIFCFFLWSSYSFEFWSGSKCKLYIIIKSKKLVRGGSEFLHKAKENRQKNYSNMPTTYNHPNIVPFIIAQHEERFFPQMKLIIILVKQTKIKGQMLQTFSLHAKWNLNILFQDFRQTCMICYHCKSRIWSYRTK